MNVKPSASAGVTSTNFNPTSHFDPRLGLHHIRCATKGSRSVYPVNEICIVSGGK